jgi:lysophospholipase L1-like esterase
VKPAAQYRFYSLIVSNLLTLSLLTITLVYYRVPQKAYRRLVVEGRIPLATAAHANNRYYQVGRDVHRLYKPANIHAIVLGDSLLGNVSMQELFDRADIAGRTIYGDTTGGVRERLIDFQNYKLEFVFILIGTNDVLNGTTDEQFEANYAEIISEARHFWPQSQICLLTIPPLAAWVSGAEQKNERIAKWNTFLVSCADPERAVVVLPLAEKLTDTGGYLRPEMTSDGVHLSAAAITQFVELSAPQLSR